MYYITLTQDKLLIATQTSPIYQGENISDSLRFIIPKTIDDVDVDTATVFLNYIKPDNNGDLDILEREADEYDDSHYQYKFPLGSGITKIPGAICIWLTIYTGSPCNPIIAKSSEYMLPITPSKDYDEFANSIPAAIYKLKEKIDGINTQIPELEKKIPDDLKIAGDPKRIHLSHGEDIIGEGVESDLPMIQFGEETPPEPSNDGLILF